MQAATPGNHDIPLTTFLDPDERATLSEELVYEMDGVLLLLDTVGSGWRPGRGFGSSYGYAPSVS